MPKCMGCKLEKSNGEFSKNRKNKNGLQDYCKICKSSIDNQFHLKSKDKLFEIKNQLGGVCKKCGEDRLHVLDFHHIDPKDKENEIGRLIYNQRINWEKIEIEVKKCILLCACCHRDFHHLERINNITTEEYLKYNK